MPVNAIRNSQFFYASALQAVLPSAGRWLDLGCGHQFLPEWLPEPARTLSLTGCRVVGIDADAAALRQHPGLELRILGSVERLPFAPATFDLVTANMVVEHVEDPEALFREVARVLAPRGTFLLHTPNLAGYTTALTRVIPSRLRPRVAGLLQGRAEHDVYRTFYRANTIQILEEVARRWALMPVELQTVESSPQTFRVPVLGALEERLLHLLRADALAHWRPCIIGRFCRADGDRTRSTGYQDECTGR